jgi:hypothetical protein
VIERVDLLRLKSKERVREVRRFEVKRVEEKVGTRAHCRR